jgi:hypothetical protein
LQDANPVTFPDSRLSVPMEFHVEKDDVDRLREILARSADRRRPGAWRFVRKFGAVLRVWRRMRPSTRIREKDKKA